jgi:hypothetical protein
LAKILKPKLLCLILATISKQPSNSQVEFVHYSLEIVNICILNKELRDTILKYELPSLVKIAAQNKPQALNEDEDSSNQQPKPLFPSTNWTEYLRILEKQEQFMSIKKMHKKITRIRKELEYWQKSQEEKPAPKETPEDAKEE